MFQREEGRVVQRDAVVHHRPIGESERENITFTSTQGCSRFNTTRLQAYPGGNILTLKMMNSI